MSRKKRKTNAKGRNQGSTESFSKLPHRIQHSRAYLSLTPTARALLFELISLEKGTNNGQFWLSEKNAAAKMGVACPKTARQAFSELQNAGLIAMTKDAYFHVKTGNGRARCWRLTWLFNYSDHASASNDWQRFNPETKKARVRVAGAQKALKAYKKEYAEIRNAQGNSTDTSQIKTVEQGNIPCTGSSTDANLGLSDKTKRGNFTPHTAVTIGKGDNCNSNEAFRTKHSPSDEDSDNISIDFTCGQNLADRSSKLSQQRSNRSVDTGKSWSFPMERFTRRGVALPQNDNDLP